MRDQALAVCRSAGAHETADFRASSLPTLLQMVASGIGVSLLPALARAAEIQEGGELVVLPFTKPRPYRTIGMGWRASSPAKPDYQELGRLVQGIIAS